MRSVIYLVYFFVSKKRNRKSQFWYKIIKGALKRTIEDNKRRDTMSGFLTINDIKDVFQIDFQNKEEWENLIHWRNAKSSGIVLICGLIIMLAFSSFSFICVISYFSLCMLTGCLIYRAYKEILSALQKTSDGHPFKDLLVFDPKTSQENINHLCSVFGLHLNAFLCELRRLFLVADFIESLKFGVILWILTYVGSWLNGMTLAMMIYISLFVFPKIYEQNKLIIDCNIDKIKSKVNEIFKRIRAANMTEKKLCEKDK